MTHAILHPELWRVHDLVLGIHARHDKKQTGPDRLLRETATYNDARTALAVLRGLLEQGEHAS